MILAAVLSLGGLVLLTFAADWLVLGSSRVATRLKIAPVIVGVVIIGLGTSAPELLVSGLAAARGDVGLATGSLVGSNILNLTLILGVAAFIAPVVVQSSVPRREAPLAFVAVGALAVTAVVGLDRLTGLVLAVLLLVTLWMLVRIARESKDDILGEDTTDFVDDARPRLGLEIGRAVAGLVGTLVGAQLLVINATSIATGFGVPQAVIGFTLVAVGTSLPELVTAIQAQRRGETDLLVGNLLGSSLFNSLGGGAAIGLAAGTPTANPIGPWLPVVMVACTGLAWLLIRRGHRVTRPEAAVLVTVYALVLPLLL